ncbi:MAG: RNA 2',3'-cyclic phosphodiesterase [Solirubrobacterales bacterium]
MRCFVALVPARSLVDALAGWGDEALGSLEWARPIPRGSLHMTLAFLGEIEADAAGRAGEVVRAIEARQVDVRLEAEVVGVPARRPRVLAFAGRGGEVEGLQDAVAGALADAGVHEPERRPFWPHVSVARVRRSSLGGGDVSTAIAALPSLGGEALQPGPAERLVLYRSHLGAGRARYEALAELALPGG